MEYVVYMPWVAAELRRLGYKILRVEVNPHKPQFDCYVFEDTDDFRKALREVSKKA